MFLLVLAHPGFPGQIPQSRKTVVCVCVYSCYILEAFVDPVKSGGRDFHSCVVLDKSQSESYGSLKAGHCSLLFHCCFKLKMLWSLQLNGDESMHWFVAYGNS